MKPCDRKQIIREFYGGASISTLTHRYYTLFHHAVATWNGIRLEIEEIIRNEGLRVSKTPSPRIPETDEPWSDIPPSYGEDGDIHGIR